MVRSHTSLLKISLIADKLSYVEGVPHIVILSIKDVATFESLKSQGSVTIVLSN